MKTLSFILLLLFAIPLIAQEKALEMSKIESEKRRVFKENKRVKVKTFDGGKYIGRFQILDANTIEIEGNIIPLSSILNIKSRTAMAGIVGTAIIIIGVGVLAIGYVGMAIHGISDYTGLYFLGGISAAIISTGVFFNEFARNYRHKNQWIYKIIDK